MEQIFFAVFLPVGLWVLQTIYKRNEDDWLLPIASAVVAFLCLWATVGIFNWEEARGGATVFSFVGKLVGMMGFAYGGILAAALGWDAARGSDPAERDDA